MNPQLGTPEYSQQLLSQAASLGVTGAGVDALRTATPTAPTAGSVVTTPTTQAVANGATPSPFSIALPGQIDPQALSYTGTAQDLLAKSQKAETQAMAERQAAMVREQQLQQQLLDSSKMTPEEEIAAKSLNEVNAYARERETSLRRSIQGILDTPGGTTQGAGEAATVAQRRGNQELADIALRQLASSDTLKTLTGFRESKTNVLKTALGFESNNVERLLGLEKEFRTQTQNLSKEMRQTTRENLLQMTDIGLKYGITFDQLSPEDQQNIALWSQQNPGLSLDMVVKSMEAGKTVFDEQRVKAAADIAATNALANERNSVGVNDPNVSIWASLLTTGQVGIQNVPMDIRNAVVEQVAKTGGNIVSPTFAGKAKEAIAAFNTADGLLNTIEQGAQSIITETDWWKLPITGTKLQVGASTRSNEDAKVYQDTINSFLSMLTRASGENGVLTQQDVQRIKTSLPSFYDTKAISERKVTQLRQLFTDIKAGAVSAYTQPLNTSQSGYQSLSPAPSLDALRAKYSY